MLSGGAKDDRAKDQPFSSGTRVARKRDNELVARFHADLPSMCLGASCLGTPLDFEVLPTSSDRE
eukprot:7884843-Lingulodinium_polyedra.AAC.1